MSGGHLSKEFFELVKSIGESRSKTEEDRIIVGEIALLKSHLVQPNISAKKMKEYMIRAVYAEMLGHDASFAYIHAVKLTHEKNLFAKRIGYLACNLFLNKDHELMLLLINTMQRDLNSANHLEVCAALTAVCRLVNLEMIPAISPLIFKLFSHPQEVVRKKAIVAVHRLFKIVPETVLDQKDMIRKVLCDPDPGVMGASLHVLFEMSKSSPTGNKDLVPSYVSILKQVTEHRLPRDFDYHRMPAPWLQVKLLSLLGVLGSSDQKASEQMYEILQECMRRADSGVNVGYAIIYECVKCITRIYPDHSLLELAASNISRFMSSDNHNIRYLGVTGLAQIVQVNPSYATEHQMAVVDCLEDPDETLKRKTLDLLFRMTNPQNVTVVVDKLTFYLRTSVDVHLRRELVQRVTSLAERFAPNNEWYVNTMNSVFELGGDLIPMDTAYNLMRLVAEGTGDDEDANQHFRTFAVNTYLKMLEKSTLSDILVQVIAWVLGEYARLATVDGYSLEDVVDLLCECVERPFEDSSTRGYLVNALMKMVGQNSIRSNSVDTVIRNYRSSRLTDLQQRCYEFEQLQQSPTLMKKVLPYDASCEDIEVNKGLTFLDSFVKSKLDLGAKPYQDAAQRHANRVSVAEGHTAEVEAKPTLNFTPYEMPSRPQPGAFPAGVPAELNAAGDNSFGSGDSGRIGGSAPPSAQGLHVSGPRRWGPASGGGGTAPHPAPPERHEPSVPSAPKPTTSAPTQATEPPALTEKQKLAASLFGSLGGSGAPPPTTPAAAPARGAAPSAPAAAAPSVSAAPAPAPAPAATAGGGAVLDLLDLDGDSGGGAASAPAAAPTPAAAHAVHDDILLLDMADAAPAPAAPPQTTAPPPPPPAAPLGLPVQQTPPQAILGPLQATIAQVGAMWGQLTVERRMQLQSSVGSCQEMMLRLQNSLHVHTVEIRGTEGIAAGLVLATNDACLLHGNLAPPRVDLVVKCRDAALAQKVAEVSAAALA